MTTPRGGSTTGSAAAQPADGSAEAPPVVEDSVEAAVRAQLGRALGGARGMVEAAVPTVAFTAIFVAAHDLRAAILVALAATAVLLVVRLVQRSTPRFVLNSLLGIAVGTFFAWRASRGGASAGDQALAYFLPGILVNLAYAVGMSVSVVVRWPVVGFLVGSVSGDPVAWHNDRGVVRLCSRLTWLLVLPCVLRVLVEGPMYLAGRAGWWPTGTAVTALGTTKLALGWPLQVLALAAMVWLLGRRRTPRSPSADATTH